VLGAVLGEWFGAPRGLGVLIVSAMQNYQINLLWAAAMLAALVSMISFGACTLLSRIVGRRWAG
jgi:ABC-type nitrate/sulfonate/bicarbonate transport system permease component